MNVAVYDDWRIILQSNIYMYDVHVWYWCKTGPRNPPAGRGKVLGEEGVLGRFSFTRRKLKILFLITFACKFNLVSLNYKGGYRPLYLLYPRMRLYELLKIIMNEFQLIKAVLFCWSAKSIWFKLQTTFFYISNSFSTFKTN